LQGNREGQEGGRKRFSSMTIRTLELMLCEKGILIKAETKYDDEPILARCRRGDRFG
jgi:hypothetical protein